MVRDWSTNPTFGYAPLGSVPGTYQVAAWVRPVGSANVTDTTATPYVLK